VVASNALAVNVSRINFIGLVVLIQGGLAAPDKARRLHEPFHILKVTAMGCFTLPPAEGGTELDAFRLAGG
jgi:hypothetical protein